MVIYLTGHNARLTECSDLIEARLGQYICNYKNNVASQSIIIDLRQLMHLDT